MWLCSLFWICLFLKCQSENANQAFTNLLPFISLYQTNQSLNWHWLVLKQAFGDLGAGTTCSTVRLLADSESQILLAVMIMCNAREWVSTSCCAISETIPAREWVSTSCCAISETIPARRATWCWVRRSTPRLARRLLVSRLLRLCALRLRGRLGYVEECISTLSKRKAIDTSFYHSVQFA